MLRKKNKHIGKLIQQTQVLPSFDAQGLWDLTSYSRMDPGLCLCCIRLYQVMDHNPPIVPFLQHTILCCLAFFPLFKMWLKQVSKPLAVRGIRFPLLWTVPCTQSILHCESSYLFPCLLAFWPPSASAFLLPSLCFPSSPPFWQRCWPGETHGLPDWLEQPGIPSLILLAGCIAAPIASFSPGGLFGFCLPRGDRARAHNALIKGIIALGRLIYCSGNSIKASPWVTVVVI